MRVGNKLRPLRPWKPLSTPAACHAKQCDQWLRDALLAEPNTQFHVHRFGSETFLWLGWAAYAYSFKVSCAMTYNNTVISPWYTLMAMVVWDKSRSQVSEFAIPTFTRTRCSEMHDPNRFFFEHGEPPSLVVMLFLASRGEPGFCAVQRQTWQTRRSAPLHLWEVGLTSLATLELNR